MKKTFAFIFSAFFLGSVFSASKVVAVSRDNFFGEITLYEPVCATGKGQSASRFNQAENTRWTGCWIQLDGNVFIHWSIPKSDTLHQPGGRVFEYPVHEFIRK
jgi:hypothetical protein